MIHEDVTSRVFDVLNRMLKADPECMRALLRDARVPCNKTFADDPEIQVGKTDSGYDVGLLGILNGICGTIEGGKYDRWGPVMAVIEDDGRISFKRTETYKMETSL